MNIDGHARRVLVAKVLAAATTYGFVLMLARTTSAQDFGLIAFFLSLAAFGSVVSAGGQQMAIVRFLPGLRPTPDKARSLLIQAYRRSITGGIATFVATYGVWLIVYPAFGSNDISQLAGALGFVLIPLMNWCDLQSAHARGLGRFVLSVVPKEILWRTVAGLILLTLTAIYHAGKIPAEMALAVMCAALIFVTLGQRRLLAPFAGSGKNICIPNPEYSRSILPFWTGSVSNIFLANADVLVVGMALGATQAGYYFVANRLAQLLAHFVTSYNVVLGPKLSAAWQDGRRADCAGYIRNATRKSTVATIVAGLGLWVLSGPILSLFGGGFGASQPSLLFLILATILNAASGPGDIALNMCGQEKFAMKIGLTSLLFGALVLVIGAIAAGATGVAAAVLVGTAFRKTLYWYGARNHLGLGCDVVSAIWATHPQNHIAVR